jgi:hypothetical protein
MSNNQSMLDEFPELAPFLEAGDIAIGNDFDALFKLVQKKFPILGTRIDWRAIPHFHQHINAAYPDCLVEIRDAVSQLIDKYLPNEKRIVSICFDGGTDAVLTCSLDTLKKIAPDVFTTPQHIYVLPSDGSWCINYSFEDDLFFGFSPLANQ